MSLSILPLNFISGQFALIFKLKGDKRVLLSVTFAMLRICKTETTNVTVTSP